MRDRATRDIALPFDDAPAAPGPGPDLTTEPPVRVPQPQVAVPGAAARWWDAHPAQLPQSTILWNDEPASSSDGAGNPVAAASAVAIRGD